MAAAEPTVLLLTGPTAAGKSTIAELLVRRYGFSVIHGDRIWRRLFGREPGAYTLAFKRDRLHQAIIRKIKRLLKAKNKVVIDYLPSPALIALLKKLFGPAFRVVVLRPEMEIAFHRVHMRPGPALVGRARLAQRRAMTKQYELLKALQPKIGLRNYIDNSGLSPSQTLKTVKQRLSLGNPSPSGLR
ncbi:MAG: AAA family ATPase [Bdellovibrionales bacterium]